MSLITQGDQSPPPLSTGPHQHGSSRGIKLSTCEGAIPSQCTFFPSSALAQNPNQPSLSGNQLCTALPSSPQASFKFWRLSQQCPDISGPRFLPESMLLMPFSLSPSAWNRLSVFHCLSWPLWYSKEYILWVLSQPEVSLIFHHFVCTFLAGISQKQSDALLPLYEEVRCLSVPPWCWESWAAGHAGVWHHKVVVSFCNH